MSPAQDRKRRRNHFLFAHEPEPSREAQVSADRFGPGIDVPPHRGRARARLSASRSHSGRAGPVAGLHRSQPGGVPGCASAVACVSAWLTGWPCGRIKPLQCRATLSPHHGRRARFAGLTTKPFQGPLEGTGSARPKSGGTSREPVPFHPGPPAGEEPTCDGLPAREKGISDSTAPGAGAFAGQIGRTMAGGPAGPPLPPEYRGPLAVCRFPLTRRRRPPYYFDD